MCERIWFVMVHFMVNLWLVFACCSSDWICSLNLLMTMRGAMQRVCISRAYTSRSLTMSGWGCHGKKGSEVVS